jgi:hypothetical protein
MYLAGLELTISSVQWKKGWEKGVYYVYVAQNYCTTRCARCMLLQHFCIQLLPRYEQYGTSRDEPLPIEEDNNVVIEHIWQC